MKKWVSSFLAGILFLAALLPAMAEERPEGELYAFTDRYNQSVEVPVSAFAAQVEKAIPGSSWTDNELYRNPENALGVDDGLTFVLGVNGTLILIFDVGVTDGEGKDLFVFETVYFDEEPESVRVEVSDDLSAWFDIGITTGYTDGLDMNGLVPEGASFRYVRLTDLASVKNSLLPGADIDAVCGVYPVSLSQAEEAQEPAPEAEAPQEEAAPPQEEAEAPQEGAEAPQEPAEATPAPAYTPVEATGEAWIMKTMNGYTNIRKNPSANSPRVVTIKTKGTEVTILGHIQDEEGMTWYYVRTPKGREGYIQADLLEP